jgi:hypothetical protein
VKKILLVASLAFVMACSGLAPELPTPIPTLTPPPTYTPPPTASATVALPTVTPTETPKLVIFVQVRLSPDDGPLSDQLADEAKEAKSLGLMPVVEFEAGW